MVNQPQPENDEYKNVWDARVAALTPILGKPGDKVWHAVIPFQLGGSADVLAFPEFVPGITFVTAEMTGVDMGQRPSTLGNYELMICAKEQLEKAADLISRLGRYTCEATLEAGETMDLGTFFGSDRRFAPCCLRTPASNHSISSSSATVTGCCFASALPQRNLPSSTRTAQTVCSLGSSSRELFRTRFQTVLRWRCHD